MLFSLVDIDWLPIYLVHLITFIIACQRLLHDMNQGVSSTHSEPRRHPIQTKNHNQLIIVLLDKLICNFFVEFPFLVGLHGKILLPSQWVLCIQNSGRVQEGVTSHDIFHVFYNNIAHHGQWRGLEFCDCLLVVQTDVRGKDLHVIM